MTEDQATGAGGAVRPGSVRCDQCGADVPSMAWCIRCGDPLEEEARRGRAGRVRDRFAAAPEERATAVRLVSTLYPSLPREEIRTFQAALGIGAALVVLLAVLGYHPVAIVAAAVLVPLVTILYLYDVDTYEDEPVRVVALTFLWGALAGVVMGVLVERIFPVAIAESIAIGALGSAAAPPFPVGRAIVAPLAGAALALAGPLVLLRYRRFNDVLDGATFGVTAAVAFTGAQTIVTSLGLFRAGLQPAGEDVVPWLVRLVSLGIATPVIAAGALGGLAGVLWLRHRGPVGDRAMLGPLGSPLVALVVAGLLVVAAPSIGAAVGDGDATDQLATLVLLTAIVGVALLWLRRIIHVGLIQEAREIPVGEPAPCPSCGRATARHTFCGACGVSLRALPKDRSSAAAGEGRLVGAWLGPRRLLVVFGVVMGAITIVALVVAFVITQGLDRPACPDRTLPCRLAATPGAAGGADALAVPDGPPFPALDRYVDGALGFAFEYDPAIWTVADSSDGYVQLAGFGGAVVLWVDAAKTRDLDAQALFELRRDGFRGGLLGFDRDRSAARILPGNPIVGHVAGIGGTFTGTLDSPQGPGTELSVAIVAASRGKASAVAAVAVASESREAGFALADTVINSFTWPGEERPG